MLFYLGGSNGENDSVDERALKPQKTKNMKSQTVIFGMQEEDECQKDEGENR